MLDVLAVVFALALPLAMFSQEFRCAISGAVTDATGASIAGARITVLETRTNTKVEVETEATGQYTAPFLLPGDYDITARVAGSIVKPNTSALGLKTFLGSAVSFLSPEAKSPYSMRWNSGWDHHLRGAIAVEISGIPDRLYQRRIQRQRRRSGAESQRRQLVLP
jgi:hypothetical protein